jgi:hypothetical protein
MLAWYDQRRREQMILHKVGEHMGEPFCVNCPSRRWPAPCSHCGQGLDDADDAAGTDDANILINAIAKDARMPSQAARVDQPNIIDKPVIIVETDAAAQPIAPAPQPQPSQPPPPAVKPDWSKIPAFMNVNKRQSSPDK